VSTSGRQADFHCRVQAVSADGGRYVTFLSFASTLVPGDTNNRSDVFVRDRKLGVTRRVSMRTTGRQAHSSSFGGALSADGRYVVFDSGASNLVAHDTNRVQDVFIRSR
jgi:hypothetical protein